VAYQAPPSRAQECSVPYSTPTEQILLLLFRRPVDIYLGLLRSTRRGLRQIQPANAGSARQDFIIFQGRRKVIMAVFEWSERYSVKVKEIDDQHKKLIALIERLDGAMRQGQGKQVLGSILSELVKYVGTHFTAEERLMKTNGYPEYEQHKVKHDRMTHRVLEIQDEFETNGTNLTFEVMKYLESWVDKHILGTDMKYSGFFKEKGVC
jgi:hemerythrin